MTATPDSTPKDTSKPSTEVLLPDSLDLAKLFSEKTEALEFVLPGFLRGTVGALVSPGGAGKSFWTLQLALSMTAAQNKDLTGLSPLPGRVVIFSAEDPTPIVADRLKSIDRAQGGDLTLTEQLDYRVCTGIDVNIMELSWFRKICLAGKGAALIVFDTLTRFHSLDENSALDAKKIMARLEMIAKRTKASVLYLHHTSKLAGATGQGGSQQAARGSSVLVDNARWASFLAVMTEAEASKFGVSPESRELYVRWNVSKQNYGASIADVWYKRNGEGVLLEVELTARSPRGRSYIGARVASRGPLTDSEVAEAADRLELGSGGDQTSGIKPTEGAWVFEQNGADSTKGGMMRPDPTIRAIPSANNKFNGCW